jgi:poly-gamma-glutamate synthesis protein (capsule biosynthesis protein)
LLDQANGTISRSVSHSYIWGAALDVLTCTRVDLCIVTLETSITRSETYERKSINYRMSPENSECLRAARIDCCVLANNHVLDWGEAGLRDTLSSLGRLGIKSAGAGLIHAVAVDADVDWLQMTLDRESQKFQSRIVRRANGSRTLE